MGTSHQSKEIRTEDGKVVHCGDRAFDYYGVQWGRVTSEPDSDGWFEFTHDDGSRTLLNGARIATYQPSRLS